MRAYFDADVLIWHLRGRSEPGFVMARTRAQGDELWMSAAQRMEVVFGLRKGEEALTAELLRDFQTEPVTELIVDLGAELYYRWHPSHGVDDEDAILAATAMLTGGKIITQNVKHFPMPGLRVERGWDD